MNGAEMEQTRTGLSDHEGTYQRKFPVFRANGERSSSQKNARKRNLGE